MRSATVTWRAAIPALVLAACMAPGALASIAFEASPKRFGVADGLSHNAVHAIVQDRHGFLWFGTQDGLDRFDGSELVHFRAMAEDAEGLASGFVTALAEGADGALWVGTRRGLHRLDPAHQVLSRIALLDSARQPPIKHLLLMGKTLWVGSESGLFLVHGDGTPRIDAAAALAGHRIMALAQSGQRLWVLSEHEACQLHGFDGNGSVTVAARPAPCSAALLAGDDGRLWLDVDRAWDPQREAAPDAPAEDVWAMHRHGDWLLVAKETGVRRQRLTDPPGEGQWLWRGLRGDGSQTLSSETLAITSDHDGGLWLGSYDGVFHFDPRAPDFQHLGKGTPFEDLLATVAVSAVWARADAAELWIGTFGHGLLRWRPDSATLQVMRHDPADPASLCSDYMFSVTGEDDAILVDGHCRVESDGRVSRIARPPQGMVRSSVRDAAGHLWLTAEDGLYRRTQDGFERVLDGAFEAVFADPDGALWLAPRGDEALHAVDQLTRFDPEGGPLQHFRLGVEENLWDLTVDANSLWIATGSGLLHLDRTRGEVRVHLPEDGDAGRVFYSLSRDRRGRFWLGSNRGLLRFDPAQDGIGTFRAYDPGDGIGNWEFNRRARFRDSSGRLYLGGMNGLTVLHPDRIDSDARPPQVLLHRAQVLGPKGEFDVGLLRRTQLRLGPDDLALSLEFAAPFFTRGDRVHYRYRLQGFDGDWLDAGRRRVVRYTNLDPGRYRFEVQAMSADGIWSERPATVDLLVAPPWHAHPAVRALLGLLLVTVLALAYRLRVKRLLAVERMRLGIAGDLHDELGSELAAISVTASLVEHGSTIGERDRGRLAAIRRSAEAVTQALRDIVWYVNPDKDRLHALIERMHSHARVALGDIELDFHAPTDAGDLPLPMETRRHVYLIFREALSNLARHASATHARIGIRLEGEHFVMDIEDDGHGFDPAVGSDGTGIASMRRRAAAIGARLDIDSASGRGTRLRLDLPMTRSRRGAMRQQSLD